MAPSLPIADAVTRVHGIREADLEGVSFTRDHAQRALRQICCDRTILVGHSIANDLEALRFCHPCVVAARAKARMMLAAPPRVRRAYSAGTRRGAAAAPTWIFRGDGRPSSIMLAAPPRVRREYSVGTCRGAAAAPTWIFRGDVAATSGGRPSSMMLCGPAAATTWIFRGRRGDRVAQVDTAVAFGVEGGSADASPALRDVAHAALPEGIGELHAGGAHDSRVDARAAALSAFALRESDALRGNQPLGRSGSPEFR